MFDNIKYLEFANYLPRAAKMIVDKYMNPNSYDTPYSSIQYWLQLSHPLARKASGEGSVLWADEATSLNYKGAILEHHKISKFLQDLVSELEFIVDEKLLLGADIQFQMPETIYDDFSNRTLHYSWKKHPGNADFVSKYSNHYFLHEIILGDNDLIRKFTHGFNQDGSLNFKTPKSREWAEALKMFKLIVGILIKMACSGSARDTEQMLYSLFETSFMQRSAFMLNNEMLLAFEYGKMSWSQDDFHPFPRLCFSRLTRLLVIYDLILYDFDVILRLEFCSDNDVITRTRHLFFAGPEGEFNTSEVSNEMASRMEQVFGQRIGTGSWRHIQQAWSDKYEPAEFTTVGLTNIAHLTANHTSATARRIYAVPLESFRGMHPEVADQYCLSSRWQHAFYGLGPRLLRSLLKQKELFDSVFVPDPYDPHSRPDLSTGSTLQITSGSSEYHQSGSIPIRSSAQDMSLVVERAIKSVVPEVLVDQFARTIAAGSLAITDVTPPTLQTPPVTVETTQLFTRFMTEVYDKPSAKLKLEQGLALQTVLDGTLSGIFILPTGGGKSALYMLPAWLQMKSNPSDNSFTVVVIPFKALLAEANQRCRQLGCMIWSPEFTLQSINTRIVLVSADQLNNESTKTMLRTAASIGRLSRIVLDEFHEFYSSFRPNLESVNSICQLGDIRFYGLSGTLSLKLETKILSAFSELYYQSIYSIR